MLPHSGMHPLNLGTTLGAAPDIGLICDDDQEKAGRAQPRATVDHIIKQREVSCARRRIRTAVADQRLVQHSVAIEKNGAARYFVLSHFVCATFSFGWLTKRCQTTA